MATNPLKKHLSYTIKDFYNEYKRTQKNKGTPVSKIISYKTYKKIVEDFFEFLQKKIIRENFIFVMPYSLGSNYIKARKTNPAYEGCIDYAMTKKVGKVVRHLNLHTFGYYYASVWDKTYVRFRNKVYYNYTSTASTHTVEKGIGRKGLSAYIIECSKDPNKKSYTRI